MDREEQLLILRKNKLDLEHQEILQDRNIIMLTEFGIPFTLLNIAVAVHATVNILEGLVIVGAISVGFFEYLRMKNKVRIEQKRSEIDTFIRQLKKALKEKKISN